MKQGVGGAFIWSLEMDDFRGSCGGGKYPLLSSIAGVLGTRSSGRSSTFLDSDIDEFYPSETNRRGTESRSRDAGAGRGLDRGGATRYRSTRRHDQPLYPDDADYDDLDPTSTGARDDRGRSAAESTGRQRHQQRRRHQSLDLDDVTSRRSSRRRLTTAADDLSDNFRRRFNDVDDDRRRSDRRHDDEVLTERRGRPDSTAKERRRTLDRDGRRRGSQDSARRAPPDAGWNDDSRASTSSTFPEEDLLATDRRSGAVDGRQIEGRSRFGSSRARTNNYDDVPVDSRCSLFCYNPYTGAKSIPHRSSANQRIRPTRTLC